MTSLEAFEHLVDFTKNACPYFAKPNDVSKICGYPIDDIRKDLEMAETLKKVGEHILIGIDIVCEKECCAMVMLAVGSQLWCIYETREYEEVIRLCELKEWLENGREQI